MNKTVKKILIGFFGIAILSGVVSTIVGNNDNKPTQPTKVEQTQQVAPEDRTESEIQADLEKLMKKEIGDSRLLGVEYLGKLQSVGSLLTVSIDASTISQFKYYSVQIMEALKDSGESAFTDKVKIVFKGDVVDQFGNESNINLGLVEVSQELINKIVYDNFNPDNLDKLADTFHVDKVVKGGNN